FGFPNNLEGLTSAGKGRLLSTSYAADALVPIITSPMNWATFGTNGRSCLHCHEGANGTLTPGDAQARFETNVDDPLFLDNDGSVSPNADVSSKDARKAAFALLLSKALIRVGLPMPNHAEFDLVDVDDPYGYASAKELSVFRRPLP